MISTRRRLSSDLDVEYRWLDVQIGERSSIHRIPGLVSVIIPTKDRPHYLRQAVESVLAQTYPKMEILIIDDGSELGGANNRAVLHPYQSQNHSTDFPKLTYIYQENRGIGATVNRGLALAQGEYIQRLDDDDRLLPEKMARSVSVFMANPSVGLVATGYHLIDAAGNPYQTMKPRRCPNPARLLNMLMGCISAQAAVMVRAKVHQKVGLYHHHKSGEDYIMWLRIARDFDVATLDDPLAEYRRHPGNTTVESHQPKLEREMLGFLVEIVATTPLFELVPGLVSEAHAIACRAAVFLTWNRQFFRTTPLARSALEAALQLAPGDPLLSLWKGMLAVYGDESLKPLPWNESLPTEYQQKAMTLAQFRNERQWFQKTKASPQEPEMVDFRRRFGRFRSALIAETLHIAMGKE